MAQKFTFAGDALTEASIQSAREWFRDNALAQIGEGWQPSCPVVAVRREGRLRAQAQEAMTTGKPNGKAVSFAFLQRAHYIQTGKSVALLGGGA